MTLVTWTESGKPARKRRKFALASVVAVAFLLGVSVSGLYLYPQFPSTAGQRNGQIFPDNNGQMGQDSNSPDKKRINMLNAERQKSLVSDSEKLLRLAKELNDEMAANESGTMSGAQLHKVEEIGKLAKSVKEKMSFSVGGYPTLTIQPPIQ